jgi:phosphomannomutase
VNYDIFHAYDVRGTYPIEIDEGICYEITLGYISLLKPKNVVVGMDARLSSPPLKESVIKALIDSGIDVLDVDRVTTDMIYFAVGHYGYSGGIIISASHNPSQYNGMKLVREKATAISSDTGLFDIRDALKEGRVRKPNPSKTGTLHKSDIFEDYVRYVLSFVDRASIEKFRFVGNGNFGFIGKPLYRIVDELGLTIIPLNLEPDGSFPKGAPDPLLPENRLETEALIKKSNVDFGVSWDADADRVMFFDENGRYIQGVYISALLAKIMLEKYGSNNKIIFDTRVIWPVSKVVNEMGGTPIVSKAGHAFMKDRMRSENALFAGELSAHYYFRDNFYADNGIIPFLLILEYLSKSKKKFSEIAVPFMQGHYMSGEFNYTVKNIKEILGKVRQRYKDYGKEDYIDGYSLETETWRFNIRASNTQPLLRLNIEAKENHLVEKIKKEIEEIIHRYGKK